MKKKLLLIAVLILSVGLIFKLSEKENIDEKKAEKLKIKKGKKTPEEKALYTKERELHELKFQINPNTGVIPLDEKEKELNAAVELLKFQRKTTSSSYISRGPSTLGGRTRSFVVDVSDATSKTIIAGGVSSGVFKTTDGGDSWSKMSSNSEIHNVTAIAQDTRSGNQNIWYYGTGEWSGNSASLGSSYRGQGVWKSTDSGANWTKIAQTDSNFTSFDSFFDYVTAIQVSPTTGDVFIATAGKIYRFDGTTMNVELEIPSNGTGWTDVKIATNGKVYVSIEGTSAVGGVWESNNGNGNWQRIAFNGTPVNWNAAGRIVLGIAPSNSDVVYALYNNGKRSNGDTNTYHIEADLWKYNGTTWSNFSSKLPDEPGSDLAGNDPFSIQGGYDLVVSVKPDNENFVVVGGTNPYRIENINTSSTFVRIGGYASGSYALYNFGGVEHHPDIHALVFDPNDPKTLYSGTDGGVHKIIDITGTNFPWVNLNNSYQTYQYYHVAMDPESGKDIVLGGAQDNGTTVGGLDYGSLSIMDKTTMTSMAGGDGVAVGIGRDNGNLRYYLGFQNGTIYQRKAGFQEITPTGSSSQFVTYFYLDPDNNNALYYAGKSSLYYTNDTENITSGTWVNAGTVSTGESLRSFATTRGAYDPASSYLFIGGESGNVYRVKDPQNIAQFGLNSVAEKITPSEATSGGINSTIVSGIAVHPTNPDIVLVVYANYGVKNIFISTNATSASPTWTEVERNLNNHSIRSAAIAEVGSEIIYLVGTARGLYSSSDPTSKNWDIEGADKMGLAVVSSLVYRPADKKLLVGTHGNGMFETTVEGTLSANSFSENSLGLSFYPNPVLSKIQLKSDLLQNNDDISYNIYDITGRLVKKGVAFDKQINVASLNSGVYIINVKSQDKQQSLKFVKK